MEGVTQWLFKVVEKMSPFTGCHYCYLVTQDGVLDTRTVVTQSMSESESQGVFLLEQSE